MDEDRRKKPGRSGEGPRPGRRERESARGGDAPRPRSAPRETAAADDGERIAKRLARAGVASRREAESLIAAGRVRVNGRVLESPALNVSRADRIEIDGQPIPEIERTRLFLFHKPAGVVTTNRDPEGRRTVFDVLPEGLPRLMTIGRLDINTEGLLLLTNDGGLARVLELPATGWLRRYRVRVHGKVEEAALAGLKDGIAVDGVFYGAVEAALDREQGSNAWLTIGLREGKNREVKNILGALGLEVTRLIRISYGPFQLGELPEGAVHELRGRTLRDQLGERLIAEAGADFDAPVVTQVARKQEVQPRSAAAPRTRSLGQEGEGGLIKNRKRQREDRREDALGRLSTQGPRTKGRFGDKGADGPRGKPGREEKPFEPPRARGANVWMAPGARPVAARKQEPETEEKPRPRDRSRPLAADPNQRMRRRPDSAEGDKRPRERRFADGPAKPYGAKRSHDDRPRTPRDDRPRSDQRATGGDDAGFRKPRRDGDRARPPRDEARDGDGVPSGDRKPWRDRPPRDDRGPTAERPARSRPAGAPRGERADGARPAGGKPFGKPGGGKPSGKPAGAKPFGKSGKPDGRKDGKPGGAPRPGKGGGDADRRR